MRNTGTLAEGAAKLAGELRAAPVERVLADANRKAVRGGAPAAFGSMSRPSVWYAFDEGDQQTPDWYPQGLTCGADSGTIPVSVFLATWYFRPEAGERGIRLTFLSPATLKYRHALLVEAAPDGSFKPIDIHAGGVACYGDLLYVADTTRGLRVFDLNHILDLTSVQSGVGDGTRIGRHGGRLHAFGYRYVIPQTDFWRVAVPGARFSFVGLDRTTTPHTLISGEYAEDHPRGRVARWNLELDGQPRDAHVMGHEKIQGAISHSGRWYLSQSAGSGANGRLIVYSGGAPARRPFPIGPEDLTARGGKVWSVTEFRNRRVVFGVNL
ncbi:hypothetical protein OUY22_06635 [Nonomuraea sp. MCN248]|uniref:Secreted protein n=1 Tax=Nonomuraea corallina TaxID=2989783 RepID=A0ABT4S7D9_9ACTN|nr:hypothetical protein [Nonomuraea corallina]MDA0633092.1 hypothetical protein [Nonomuraea corallina]